MEVYTLKKLLGECAVNISQPEWVKLFISRP